MGQGQTTQLIAYLEREARDRATALEAAGKLPAGFVDRHYPLTRSERLELQRLKVAWRLATDADALKDLVLGVPVDPDRVDREELDWALTESLVRLVRPIDVLHGRAA